MTDKFDVEAFLGWLDEQDGPLTRDDMEEWPNFPWRNVQCVTGPITDDGEFAYYKRDLRRAARGRKPID